MIHNGPSRFQHTRTFSWRVALPKTVDTHENIQPALLGYFIEDSQALDFSSTARTTFKALILVSVYHKYHKLSLTTLAVFQEKFKMRSAMVLLSFGAMFASSLAAPILHRDLPDWHHEIDPPTHVNNRGVLNVEAELVDPIVVDKRGLPAIEAELVNPIDVNTRNVPVV